MNRKLLKKIMSKRGFSVGELAERIPLNKIVLSCRLGGISEFTLFEIQQISKILELDRREIMLIFFGEKFPKGNKKRWQAVKNGDRAPQYFKNFEIW